MRTRDQEEFQRKKIMLMEKCYDCYAENGLASVGIRKLAESCGCSSAVLYIYFRDLDDLIVQSTAYCMEKVEDDFMAKAPTDPQDLMRFIDEIPYWTARQHGKKYRLMYQVYTHPKYIRYGKQFFEGGQPPLHRIRQIAGAQAGHPLYHHHPADLHPDPDLRPLRHVRG